MKCERRPTGGRPQNPDPHIAIQGQGSTATNCSVDGCTLHVEIVPRLRFARQVAERSLLELDDLTTTEVLLAISTSLEIAERYASTAA